MDLLLHVFLALCKKKLGSFNNLDSNYWICKVFTWIYQSCYVDVSKFLHVFSRPLSNETKLKFWQCFTCWYVTIMKSAHHAAHGIFEMI